MISKEQIAHDLTMIYMQNRYGINVNGDFYFNDDSGSGSIKTEYLPGVSEPQYIKVGTGEKGLFGLEKKQKVQSGNKIDALFEEMVSIYHDAYLHFYRILCEKNNVGEG